MAAHPEQVAESLLAWWREAGVDAPPFDLPAAETRAAPGRPAARARPEPKPAAASAPVFASARAKTDPVEDARAAAAACGSLEELRALMQRYEGHPLRATARNLVFARGNPDAPVMIVGEAPGGDEDAQGLPFVGRSGKLMDRMFAAVGLTDAKDLYVTNVVTWRPPGNRKPNDQEIAISVPFVERHVALKKPKILVLAGSTPAQTLLRTTQGVTRLRGTWRDYEPRDGGPAIPALAIFHPAYVLRRAISKREVWRDLLALQDKLNTLA